jgi:hypothetical protein
MFCSVISGAILKRHFLREMFPPLIEMRREHGTMK